MASLGRPGVPRWLSPVRRESGKLVVVSTAGVQRPAGRTPPVETLPLGAPPTAKGRGQSNAPRKGSSIMSVGRGESERALEEIRSLLEPGGTADALYRVCRSLRRHFRHYHWVGIYLLRGEELFLVAWDGKAATEHVRIPLGRGVCGRAAREGRTVNVPDVRASADYLACFLETRSEIVVPIKQGGRVLGEIDIDGDQLDSYDASDEVFLEQVALLVSSHAAEVRDGVPAPPVGPTAPGSF